MLVLCSYFLESLLIFIAGKPTKVDWLMMVSLSFISFTVAIDATILVTVLPASIDARNYVLG
jgi:hypothetical protein